MDGAWDSFLIKLKSAILAIFQRGLGWPWPVCAAVKNAHHSIWKILKDWKAKLESAYSFMLKYSRITVWDSTTGVELFRGDCMAFQEVQGSE